MNSSLRRHAESDADEVQVDVAWSSEPLRKSDPIRLFYESRRSWSLPAPIVVNCCHGISVADRLALIPTATVSKGGDIVWKSQLSIVPTCCLVGRLSPDVRGLFHFVEQRRLARHLASTLDAPYVPILYSLRQGLETRVPYMPAELAAVMAFVRGQRQLQRDQRRRAHQQSRAVIEEASSFIRLRGNHRVPEWVCILGLEEHFFAQTLDQNEVKAAYRAAAKRCHPDAGGDAIEFRRVEQAFRTALDALQQNAKQ